MKKRFIRILTLIAVVVLFTGCSVGEKPTIEENIPYEEVSANEENEIENEDSKDAENEENISEKGQNSIESIDLTKEPNELGEIMILMYHGIGDEETVWQRTAANFRKDLEYMYKNGYRMISLNDYARGEINTEEGYTPIILTFDDGRQNNFNLIEEDGKIVLDPNCAVGVLEEFKSKYPDFNVTASFFLGTNPFGQIDYAEQKLNWLIENGYDIGNHTYSHDKMETLTGEEIQAEIGSVNNIIGEYISDYAVETLALPHGSNPNNEFIKDMLEGEYEGNSYKTVAVLDVGWRPAYSPFDTLTDFKSLYRVTASEIDVDGCGIYDYFKQFEENNRERFISDGLSEVITIPERHKEYLNMDMVKDKQVNIYE